MVDDNEFFRNATLRICGNLERDLEPMQVDVLVDSGAIHLCIPEHLRIQLKLPEIDKKVHESPVESSIVDSDKPRGFGESARDPRFPLPDPVPRFGSPQGQVLKSPVSVIG